MNKEEAIEKKNWKELALIMAHEQKLKRVEELKKKDEDFMQYVTKRAKNKKRYNKK